MSAFPLRLYNTLTREVAEFEALHPPDVGMYSCGPTVYAYQHIGNLRAYVFADSLKRALLWKGFRVHHVINITDVGHLTSDADEGEDKLELAARREGRNVWQIADFYTQVFKEDLGRIGVLEPDVWCKATDHIQQMINFAADLEAAGWCYALASGLYLDTAKVRDYGRLACLELAGQLEGARIEAVEGKRNPSDFAVWRTSPDGVSRQMEWDSPWGRGTPGWHLECSVMSIQYLGRHFDIHTGGVDHISVHHTNEIAQSEAYLADGQPWVGWWLHGDFINLKGAKISKSTGGGVILSDLVDRGYHPLVYRYLLLQAHYRSQLDFSWEAMDSAKAGLRRLLDRYASARSQPSAPIGRLGREYIETFDRGISDDLNTAIALTAVVGASRDDRIRDGELNTLAAIFDPLLGIGLIELEPADLDLKRRDVMVTQATVEGLMDQRNAARATKDFARSDALRRELTDLGVVVEDPPGAASTWRWA